MITKEEVDQLLASSEHISDAIIAAENPKDSLLWSKSILNYMEKVDPSSLQSLSEIMNSPELGKKQHKIIFRYLLEHIIKVGSEELQYERTYSTGQIAKFFGVSTQTIHAWIKEGRISGVEKSERFKHIRIPETAIYLSSIKERFTIAQIIEMYEEEQAKRGSVDAGQEHTYAERLSQLSTEISIFENKYGGSFENTLGKVKTKSLEQERDASEWQYLMRKVREL
ncbi:helix-turn-helix domain-containing protein [Brevibacillus reuszeri]|uniref:helix-turn-helix domain-containing protein n=1 Tax=Brevibacillus reuszeri TaxID=54915 RepID=UPI0013DF280B|nr:helix-turn-helix domain-containing protein [Brevibacillus reuszeri]